MAYFARIDNDGTVLQVIADVLGLPGEWRQTSYNNNFRKQYAGIGWLYDANADVFVAPQPFTSWTLDANHDWQPPTPIPTEGGPWRWDEATLSWVEVTA